jgi:hypothetical protein
MRTWKWLISSVIFIISVLFTLCKYTFGDIHQAIFWAIMLVNVTLWYIDINKDDR